MRIITKTIEVTTQRPKIRLSFLGDWHIGSAACSTSYIKSAIKQIEAEEDHYIIGMGDFGDYIPDKDPRYERQCLDPRIKVGDNVINWQIDEVCKILKPVKDRLICILSGNHETKMDQCYYINPCQVLAHRLDTEHLGYSGFVRLHFKKKKKIKSVTIYIHHGCGGGGTLGAKLNRLGRLAGGYVADIHAMGHVHALGYAVKTMVYPAGKRLTEKNIFHILTGTALKTHIETGAVTYSEKAGYEPATLGHPEVEITPFFGHHHETRIEVTPRFGR